MYAIKFNGLTMEVSDEGLLNFIKVAVIMNRDVNTFTVIRIKNNINQ